MVNLAELVILLEPGDMNTQIAHKNVSYRKLYHTFLCITLEVCCFSYWTFDLMFGLDRGRKAIRLEDRLAQE